MSMCGGLHRAWLAQEKEGGPRPSGGGAGSPATARTTREKPMLGELGLPPPARGSVVGVLWLDLDSAQRWAAQGPVAAPIVLPLMGERCVVWDGNPTALNLTLATAK